jgi:hypothetical protein
MATTTKVERVETAMLRGLLEHQGVDAETRKSLCKYRRSVRNLNEVEVSYAKSKKTGGELGRVYAQSSSLQLFSRDLRNALGRPNYFDVDVENAHPRILLQICEQHGWCCEALKRYVDARDAVLTLLGEVFCVDRDGAKKMVLTIMYLGGVSGTEHPQAPLDKKREARAFVSGLAYETDQAARNICERHRMFAEFGQKRKAEDPTGRKNPLASALSLYLQNEEYAILHEIDLSLQRQGRSMDVLIHDGGLVRKESASEIVLPDTVLRTCERDVNTTLSYDIKLVVKDMTTSIVIPVRVQRTVTVPAGEIVDDWYAAKVAVNVLRGRIVALSQDALFVFDDQTGMWSNDESVLRNALTAYESHIRFSQMDDNGRMRTYNYVGNHSLFSKMLRYIPAECIDTTFFSSRNLSSKGKLLFADGIYDFPTKIFIPGFDPNIVFFTRIARKFPTQVSQDDIDWVDKVLFRDPFIPTEYAAADYLKLALARGLAMDFRIKKAYFCMGNPDAGKGVMADALKAAFEGYVDFFEASNFSKRTSDEDAAKSNSWIVPLKKARLAFSSEIPMDRPMNGTLLKKVASGGDQFVARQNYTNEEPVILTCTLFFFSNDLPKILPVDDAVMKRTRYISFKCTFQENPTELELQSDDRLRVADGSAKDRFELEISIKDALVTLLLRAYDPAAPIDQPPECVLRATEKWSGGNSQLDAFRKLFATRYVLTQNSADHVPTSEVFEFIGPKMDISPVVVGRLMGKMGVKSDRVSEDGSQFRVYPGVAWR